MLSHVVEPKVERETPGRRLKNQLSYAGVPQLRLQVFAKVQIIHPVRDRNLKNVWRSLPLLLGQVKGEPAPHIGSLHIPGPEKQLPRMKRPTGRVANLPVGLYDSVAGGEVGLHLIADLMKYSGEEPLVFLGESQKRRDCA